MSAFPPKADIDHGGGNVRFVPKADIAADQRNVRFIAIFAGRPSRSPGVSRFAVPCC